MVEGVTTDAQLGEFYAENGFMPELDTLPDSVFQLLDFDKLREKMHIEDGSILGNRGYVSQYADLKQVYDTLFQADPVWPGGVQRWNVNAAPPRK